MEKALIIVHVVISVILILVVLLQQGKQQGLSGAIAGGADTFYGKNKGRTLDAVLNKVTSVVAILFVISAIALTVISVNDKKAADAEAAAPVEVTETAPAEGETVPVETETAVVEGEEAEAPVEGEEAPAEGEEAPAEE